MASAQPISESELEIMQVLWESQGRVFLAPLMEALADKGKTWKANTVLTFLTRLEGKGLIRIEKEGRLNGYTALYTQEEYLQSQAQTFVAKVYGGDAKGLVAALLRQDCLTREDIEELRAFWEEGQ